MPKAKLLNGVHVYVKVTGWMDAAMVRGYVYSFEVNDLMHCFSDHLCLCGIVLQAFRDDKENPY
jgi:hypothetical protein